MPIMTMCAPIARARSSASLRLSRSSASSSAAAVPASARRTHVHLDVELAHLGLEDLVGDRGEDLLVAHRRVLLGVDEVELDLDAGQRPLEVELRLVEHPAEHVQAAPQLLPVAQPVPAGERPGLDLFAHAGRLPSSVLCGQVGTEPAGRQPGRAAASRRPCQGDDVKVTDSWYSERLEQPIGLARWGHYGTPVLVFPTAGGDAEEIERNGLVGACWPLIESGRIKLYSCDSVAGPGDGRQGRLAGVPDVAVQPVPPLPSGTRSSRRSGPTLGGARDADPRGRRLDRGVQRRWRCSAGSRTCSAPPSA